MSDARNKLPQEIDENSLREYLTSINIEVYQKILQTLQTSFNTLKEKDTIQIDLIKLFEILKPSSTSGDKIIPPIELGVNFILTNYSQLIKKNSAEGEIKIFNSISAVLNPKFAQIPEEDLLQIKFEHLYPYELEYLSFLLAECRKVFELHLKIIGLQEAITGYTANLNKLIIENETLDTFNEIIKEYIRLETAVNIQAAPVSIEKIFDKLNLLKQHSEDLSITQNKLIDLKIKPSLSNLSNNSTTINKSPSLAFNAKTLADKAYSMSPAQYRWLRRAYFSTDRWETFSLEIKLIFDKWNEYNQEINAFLIQISNHFEEITIDIDSCLNKKTRQANLILENIKLAFCQKDILCKSKIPQQHSFIKEQIEEQTKTLEENLCYKRYSKIQKILAEDNDLTEEDKHKFNQELENLFSLAIDANNVDLALIKLGKKILDTQINTLSALEKDVIESRSANSSPYASPVKIANSTFRRNSANSSPANAGLFSAARSLDYSDLEQLNKNANPDSNDELVYDDEVSASDDEVSTRKLRNSQ